jgi:hypothetical protein
MQIRLTYEYHESQKECEPPRRTTTTHGVHAIVASRCVVLVSLRAALARRINATDLNQIFCFVSSLAVEPTFWCVPESAMYVSSADSGMERLYELRYILGKIYRIQGVSPMHLVRT